MAALYGAVALEKVNNITQFISQYLYLDMARSVDAGFQKNIGAAESLLYFREHTIVIAPEFRFTVTAAYTSAATTGSRLQHDRVADIVCQRDGFLQTGQAGITPGDNRHTGSNHASACLDLVAHFTDYISIRSDELDAAPCANFCKTGVLGKKTIAWMDCVAAGSDCKIDDAVGVQIAGNRIRADVIGFVGLADMQGMLVGICVDSHRLDACFLAGSNNADSNFTAVGYKDLGYQVSLAPVTQVTRVFSGFC